MLAAIFGSSERLPHQERCDGPNCRIPSRSLRAKSYGTKFFSIIGGEPQEREPPGFFLHDQDGFLIDPKQHELVYLCEPDERGDLMGTHNSSDMNSFEGHKVVHTLRAKDYTTRKELCQILTKSLSNWIDHGWSNKVAALVLMLHFFMMTGALERSNVDRIMTDGAPHQLITKSAACMGAIARNNGEQFMNKHVEKVVPKTTYTTKRIPVSKPALAKPPSSSESSEV